MQNKGKLNTYYPMQVLVWPIIFDKEKSITSLSTSFVMGVKRGQE
jgi:hypothetical protein